MVRFMNIAGSFKLVPFSVGQKCNARGDEHRRNDEYKDAASQGLNQFCGR